jgi:Monooxygenase af470-like
MAQTAGRRMMAEIDGDFVVFLIGARPSKLHLVRSLIDLGGRRGMKHMLDYLVAHPDKGLLGYQLGLPVIVQYWRSFEHLEAFARDAADPHLAVWRNYWRRVGNSGRTGIWHETYLVRAGEYEAIYGNMPPFGLGKAGRLVPLSESSGARHRIKATAGGGAEPAA